MVLERWDILILDENGNSCNRCIEFEDDIKVNIYTNYITLSIRDVKMNIYYSGLALRGKKGSLHIFMNDNADEYKKTKNITYVVLEYYYDYFINKLWIEDKPPRLFYAISKYATDHKLNKWIGITREDKINFIRWVRSTTPRYMPEKVSKILNNCQGE